MPVIFKSLKKAQVATKAEKVSHVLTEMKKKDHQGHRCHWPGCTKTCAPAQYSCRPHWFMLPKHLRDKVWATYRPGQEVTKTPSAAYIGVTKEVHQWIKEHYPNG